MRLFVAIDIDEAIRQRIADYVALLKKRGAGVRFVSPASYHITLKFLGETDKLREIVEALRTVEVEQFELAVRGAGFFPNERSPRVFWAGIEAPNELRELADWTSSAVSPLGFGKESAFKPHLTLARSGSGSPHQRSKGRSAPGFERVRQLITSEPQPDFGTMSAREFFLFESRLKPTGAEYIKLERFDLVRRAG